MADNLKDKFTAVGEKLKVGGSDLARKMSERMNSVSGKIKELFLVPTAAEKIVEEATADTLDGPEWSRNLDICDLVNHEKISGPDAVRAIKKRLMVKNPTVQMLSLAMLEAGVKNCDKFFSEVAAERVLDEMVKLIEDPQTSRGNREKALKLIEAWGESTEELRYLPIYEETYKSLRNRGVQFPGRDNESLAPIFTPPGRLSVTAPWSQSNDTGAWRDDYVAHPQPEPYDSSNARETLDIARNSVELLSTVLSSSPEQEALEDDIAETLVEQCRQLQINLQKIILKTGDNDPMLFEALDLNDELAKVLSRYESSTAAPTVSGAVPRVKMVVAPAPFTNVATPQDDDFVTGTGENSLVRNYGRAPLSSQGDDKAMADLDEMIFGKGGDRSS